MRSGQRASDFTRRNEAVMSNMCEGGPVMMIGMAIFGLMVIIALGLGIVALVKYLRTSDPA